jgi:hypothetical protein
LFWQFVNIEQHASINVSSVFAEREDNSIWFANYYVPEITPMERFLCLPGSGIVELGSTAEAAKAMFKYCLNCADLYGTVTKIKEVVKHYKNHVEQKDTKSKKGLEDLIDCLSGIVKGRTLPKFKTTYQMVFFIIRSSLVFLLQRRGKSIYSPRMLLSLHAAAYHMYGDKKPKAKKK